MICATRHAALDRLLKPFVNTPMPSCLHVAVRSLLMPMLMTMGCIIGACEANASPLVYQPVNPSFGGNPLNGSVLLNEAQAQNDYKAPVRAKSPQDRLDAFAEALQNAVLNRVSSAAIRTIVNADGALIPGTVTTQDFIITVTDLGNGLVRVTTTDRTTGQTSTFEIGTTNSP